jgi:uncharacterized protein YpmB
MVTKMSDTTEIITTEETSKEVAVPDDVKALLAEAAKEGIQNEKGSSIISLKGKKFSAGEIKLGTELTVVILADAYDNAYYDSPYQDGVVNSPACWALGVDDTDLAPNPDEVPNAQSEDCESCEHNKFGSKGNGKTCRNGRRLLVAPYINGEVSLGEVAMITIAPTTLKNYSKYKRTLAHIQNKPLWAVGTHLTFNDDVSYPMLEFSYLADVTSQETLLAIHAKQSLYRSTVLNPAPYSKESYKAPDDAPSGNRSKMS